MTFNYRDLVVHNLGEVMGLGTGCASFTVPMDDTCAGPSCGYPSSAATEAAENGLDLLRQELQQALLVAE